MSVVRADSSGVRRALRRVGQGIEDEAASSLAVAAQVAEAAAKATTKWKDGAESNPDGSPRRHGVHTRDTIEGSSSGLRGRLEAAGAARFLENGTKPHLIVPRRKKFLRFWANGEGPFFRRIVHHRGTQPTFFLRDAAHEAERYLEWKLRADARRVVRAAGLSE